VGGINVHYKVIFGRVCVVKVNVAKTIFKLFKLVKQPLESNKDLPNSTMAAVLTAAFD
jgi:hypothetical protein